MPLFSVGTSAGIDSYEPDEFDEASTIMPEVRVDRAPFARGSATSEAAARSMDAQLNELQNLVLNLVRAAGGAGVTCDEVEARLNLRHQTASARINELVRKGKIVDAGKRRKTRSGRAATVWIVRTTEA